MKKELVCLFILCGIARGSTCEADSNCQGLYQKCQAGKCRCKYRSENTTSKIKTETLECLGPKCNTDNDCSGHYQKCWKGECVCKYPAKEDVTKCQRPNSCDYDGKPCHSDRMMCIAEDCQCRSNYRTLTDSYGIITDCYVVYCYNDNECGVFEKCEKEKCTCSVWPETKPGHNTTCVGTFCMSENCGDYQECGKRNDRCACKYGTITRSNRTTVCVNPYSCTSDGECTINGYCLNNTCQCGDGFNGDIDDQGKFQCNRPTGLSIGAIVGIVFGVIAGIAGIVLLCICVKRRTRVTQGRCVPLRLSSTTARPLNNEPGPRTPSNGNADKPNDWPAASQDQPPSYEVATGISTISS